MVEGFPNGIGIGVDLEKETLGLGHHEFNPGMEEPKRGCEGRIWI